MERTVLPQEYTLMDAILLEPEDDLPRLVYADYLEETGDPDWAEFVRAQVEVGRHLSAEQVERLMFVSGRSHLTIHQMTLPHVVEAWDRMLRLFHNSVRVKQEADYWRIQLGAVFHRGTIAVVRCPWEKYGANPLPWSQFGAKAVLVRPVERVELIEKVPQKLSDDIWVWHLSLRSQESAWDLHRDLFDLLPTPDRANYFERKAWLTEQGARDALSIAAIIWARREAGLPPLEAPR